MKKYTLLFIAIIFLLALSLMVQAQIVSAANLPSPCQDEWPNVYLVVDHTRRHIVDWDTFLNLGYLTPDIVPCGDAANDPEGNPISRLLKGSGVEVYLVTDGIRHHIADMATFNVLGFHTYEITVLPDDVLALWPLGEPLASSAPVTGTGDTVYREFTLGDYTVHLWHPGQGMHDFVTLTATNRADVRVDDLDVIGSLPAADVTGEGDPDLLILTHPNGSAHCCYGSVLYNLGEMPTKILDILSPAYQLPGTGRGDFQDIDGDGRYEFITLDPLQGIACTQPSVYTILQYAPAQGRYVGATPHFASYRADTIARYLQLPATSDPCTIYPMVTTLFYMGKANEAKAAYDRLYRGADAAAYWETLKTAAEQGHFYIPAG